jgi:hypothetical protein
MDDEDDSTSEPAPFMGTWTYTDSAYSCAHTIIFGKRQNFVVYEIDLACALATGGVGVQVETGEYTVGSEGETMFVPSHATCTGGRVVPHTDTVEQVGATLLRVKNSDGTTTYELTTQGGLGPNVITGCFGIDGSFTPGSLAEL